MKKLLLFVSCLLLVFFHASGNYSVSIAETDLPDVEKQAPELMLQTGHSKAVKAVIFSPHNRWLASGSFDNTIKIWDFDTGRELRALTGHSGAVKALASSPDGKWLASGGNDRTVRIWEVESGREISNFDSQDGAIEAIAFSPDGKRIASGESGNTIIIRDTETGKELAKLTGHTASVTALAFSHDGRFLASGSSDQTVKIWDAGKGKKLRTLKGHADKIGVLRFSQDGGVLASGSSDKTVRLWTTSNGREMAVLKGHAGNIAALSFIADGKLMSVDTGRLIKTWNTAGKPELAQAEKATEGGAGDEIESADFNIDGKFLAAGNGDGTVTLFNTKTGEGLRTLENHTSGFYGVAFSSDRHWLASASFDNTVKLWDLQTGQSLAPLKGHTGYVTCVVFHPDNRKIISGSVDKTIRIWDAFSQAVYALNGHTGSISSLAIGGKGKLLVSGSADQTIGLWDLETKNHTRVLKGHSGEVISVAISSDERLIASGSMDTTIKIWDVRTGVEVRTIEPKSGEVDAVAFSPDGRLVASGGIDKRVRVWETDTGRLVLTLPGHTAKINAVSFSPDGKQIASTGQDKTVWIWSVSDGQKIRELVGHAGTVFSVTFSSDGKWLASASDDGSVIIWKVDDGRRMSTLISIKASGDWLVVTPEGFFDGSPASWDQLSWRFERNTFNVKPVEVFFNEFYSPGLLADLFTDGKLPSNSNILDKDRRQPELKLALVDAPANATLANRDLKIKIDISQAAAGAQDVRLFRNGSLVKVWRGDVLKGQRSVTLEATIPIVAGENRLTTYAFNHDNIKSSQATLVINGADSLRHQGTAYVLAVGVNAYSNSRYNLKYAVPDAQVFSAEIKREQESLKHYARVEVVPLYDKDATKANILQALSRLAEKVQPEDAVIVYFSGHGTAKQQRFYLIPYDLGYQGLRTKLSGPDLQTILRHSISDREMEDAFEKIDAGQVLIVIDACNSGQALESEEKRRGPMNSKGLAQLAYEKGMYVLTAAQSYQAAWEASRLGHGFLTYALIEAGLKQGAADRAPKDGAIVLREWLDFATEEVPRMQEEKMKQTPEFNEQQRRELELVLVEGDENFKDPETRTVQRPRVFYRREADTQPLIVAKP